jgi:hypothetical protein
MHGLSIESLAHRLERLERENRRWKAGAVIVLACSVVLLLLGAAPKHSDEIKAQQFVAVDETGKPRAVLTAEPALYFFTKTGQALVRLVVYDGLGPNLWLRSAGEGSLVRIAAQKDGAFLNMRFPPDAGASTPAAAFFGALDNGVGMKFTSQNNKPWAELNLNRAGKPFLRLQDATSGTTWKIP